MIYLSEQMNWSNVFVIIFQANTCYKIKIQPFPDQMMSLLKDYNPDDIPQ